MPRKNLDAGDSESSAMTVRLGRRDREALSVLEDAWGGSLSDSVRRALRETAQRVSEGKRRHNPRGRRSRIR